jgi:hypothetical protein
MSEDGQYWWDENNQQWQPVQGGGGNDPVGPAGASSSTGAGAGSAAGGGGGEVGQLSEDGQYRWDGQQWQPAQGDGAGGGGNDGTVELPGQVIDMLANFRNHFPEVSNLATVNDHDQYMTHIVGISQVPTEDAN